MKKREEIEEQLKMKIAERDSQIKKLGYDKRPTLLALHTITMNEIQVLEWVLRK